MSATTVSTTQYDYLATASGSWSTTEAPRKVRYRTTGTISKLYVVVSANTTSATNTLIVRKNGADTALTVTIGAGATGAFEDTTNIVSVDAGDDINTKVITGAGGAMTFRVVSVIFEASSNTVTVMINSSSVSVASVTRFGYIEGGTAYQAAEAASQYTARTPGILKNMAIVTGTNARTTSTTFTSRKNVADGTLTLTVLATDDDVLLEDTANSDTFDDGDEINYKVVTGSGTGTLAQALKSEFETTNGKFLLIASNSVATNFATTHYNTIAGALSAAVTTEANNQIKTRMPTKFSNLACYVLLNTIDTGTSTVNLRVNGVDSGISLSIPAGTTGYFEDLVNTVSTDADDEITTSWVKSGASGAMTILTIACIGEEIIPVLAFDAFSASVIGTGSPTWTHTPVGTPKGVIVFVVNSTTSDAITGVTYGGTAMTEVSGSPLVMAIGAGYNLHCYVLTASVPTGAQTVVATSISSTSIAYAITLTATGDIEVIDTDASIAATGQTNPSATLALAGRTCFCAMGFASDHDTAAAVTPFANWNARDETVRSATEIFGCYTYDVIGSTDVTMGWTQASGEAVAIGIAVADTVLESVVAVLPNPKSFPAANSPNLMQRDAPYAMFD